MGRILVLALLITLGSSCSMIIRAQPGADTAAGGPSINVLPTLDHLYKIPGDLGFENWNFGLEIKGLNSHSDIGRMVFRHYSKGSPVHQVTYEGQTLGAFLAAEGSGRATLRPFHISQPASMAIDWLEIEIDLGTGGSARKKVPLLTYRQRHRYRLPVSGCWFISSGHDFGVEHRRHLSRGHFAWDFVITDKNGSTSSGPSLENHYSFGQAVLATADGEVVDVKNEFPDNLPGVVGDRTHSNYVVIDHGDGVFSRAVHLKKGSVVVSMGERVKEGQVIGAVGNSGASDQPHLHFQFQTEIADARGGTKTMPLPVRFNDYRVNWNQGMNQLVKEGRPRRGQHVCGD